MRSGLREVEDVPELMQHILSRLPVKEAARTSVLSKSWLHAWSTIPTLRFLIGRGKSMKVVDMERTLIRYLRDNVPIERFALIIDLENQEAASHAGKCIRHMTTKCLKEFFLSISLNGFSFTLPGEILSGENLTKIRLTSSRGTHSVCMMSTSQHPVVNCVSLQQLHLDGVCISEELLDGILSSCRLLVKIVLIDSCKGFKTIKVKNLPRLHEFSIALDARHQTALEISDVPNLGVLNYELDVRFRPHERPPFPFNAYSISSGSSVTRMVLAGVITDNACLDIFKSQFPFLEDLTLHLTSWKVGNFHLTSASIKRLSLMRCPYVLIDVQVHAPKLLFFELEGNTLTSLLFPVSSLKQIKVSLMLRRPVDADFFIKMREALTLSRMCYLRISTDNSVLQLDIDMDDLRTRLLLPPARNVQLSFQTSEDECLWERSLFFDAFFLICHPRLVFANPDFHISQSNHFCRLMLREVLEKKTTTTTTAYWTQYLKHVQVRQGPHQKWRTLTDSFRRILDGSVPDVLLEFKLMWG